MNVYLHILYMYNGNVEQNPLCAASCVIKDIHISPRFLPTGMILYRDANSVLSRAHLPMYSSRLYAQSPVFEIVHEDSVKAYSTHTCSWEKQYRINECICAARVTAQNI